jgi:thiamine biosynthesis lipoprotein ApbE
VRDAAVATSGNHRRFVEIGGKRHPHIMDPRTGTIADEVLGATVVSRDAAEAGALATACIRMNPPRSRSRSWPSIASATSVAATGKHVNLM